MDQALVFAEINAIFTNRCINAHLALLIKARMYRMAKAMSELTDESKVLSEMLFDFIPLSDESAMILMYSKKDQVTVPAVGVIHFRVLDSALMEIEQVSIRLGEVDKVRWQLTSEKA